MKVRSIPGLVGAVAMVALIAGCTSASSTSPPAPSADETAVSPASPVAGPSPARSPSTPPGTPLPSGWSAGTGPASPEIVAALEGRIDAFNRGDFKAAAAFWTEDGRLLEYEDEAIYTQGREAIAKRLEGVYGIGVRMEPVGVPLQYGRLVAEPVRFVPAPGIEGYGEGMLVFEVNNRNEIVWESVSARLQL